MSLVRSKQRVADHGEVFRTRKIHTFVSTQAWTKPWTDAALHAKYGLNDEEIVRPMKLTTDLFDGVSVEGGDDG